MALLCVRRHGDGLDWLARVQGVSVPTVIRTLATAPAPVRTPPPPTAATVLTAGADPDPRHRTYRALLRARPLSPAHRAWLADRGIDPDQARQRGYGSLQPGPAPVVPEADGVPGFYRAGTAWRLAGPAGLALPVRDAAVRIQGIQVHADDPSHGKYRWLSSPNRPGGASSGAPPHVTPGTGQSCGSPKVR